jgi:hypothetical protein
MNYIIVAEHLFFCFFNTNNGATLRGYQINGAALRGYQIPRRILMGSRVQAPHVLTEDTFRSH